MQCAFVNESSCKRVFLAAILRTMQKPRAKRTRTPKHNTGVRAYVMSIAFGWSLLDHHNDSEAQASAGSGQELDRRGETEGEARLALAGSARAAEVSVKRYSQATRDRSTEGAEATSAAKSSVHQRRNPTLPDAAKKGGLSALLNPGSTVPSGR